MSDAPVVAWQRNFVRFTRAWWGIGGALVVTLGAVLAFLLHATRSPLSADEAMLVGRWYGRVMEEDGSSASVIIEDYQDDRTLAVTIRKFRRASAEASAVWTSKPGESWERFHGTWHQTAGITHWEVHDPKRRRPLWRRLITLVRERRWERAMPGTVDFRVASQSTGAKHFALTPKSYGDLLSLRVPDDFEPPDEPFTPEEALAWWAQVAAKKRN